MIVDAIGCSRVKLVTASVSVERLGRRRVRSWGVDKARSRRFVLRKAGGICLRLNTRGVVDVVTGHLS